MNELLDRVESLRAMIDWYDPEESLPPALYNLRSEVSQLALIVSDLMKTLHDEGWIRASHNNHYPRVKEGE